MDNKPSMIGYLLPKLQDALFIILFSAAILFGPRMLNIDGDLPRHLLMGKITLETKSIPTTEIFSYVYEGRPYAPHEWLADVVFYLIYLALGLSGIVFLAAFLIAIAFFLIYKYTTSHQESRLLIFFLTLWGASVSSLHWITRPHLFSMLFLAITLILIDKISRGQSVKVWGLPLLMLIWSNTHAEFIAGFLVILAYIAGWIWDYFTEKESTSSVVGKNLGLTLGFAFLATLPNPVGVRVWDVVFRYVNNRYLMSRINETNPPDFTQSTFLFLLGLIIVSVIMLALKKGKLPTAHAFLLAGFTTMTLLSARNVHLYGIVVPFVLAGTLRDINLFSFINKMEASATEIEKQLRGVLWPIGISILFIVLLTTTSMGQLNEFSPSVFPVEAIKWLEANPQTGRMFNAFNWGGYLLLYLWPDQKVFIESQTDVYGEVTQKYETVVTLGDGWQDIFKQYDIEWAIIAPDLELARVLIADDWNTLYQDKTAIVLRKP